MKVYPLPTVKTGIPINTSKQTIKITNYVLMMAPINADIEHRLDKKHPVYIDVGGCNCCAMPKNVLVYGSINFDDKYDCNLLEKINIPTDERPCYVYQNYDYETNTVTTEYPKGLCWKSSVDNIEIFKFAHGRLGKPERVVIFKAYGNLIRPQI